MSSKITATSRAGSNLIRTADPEHAEAVLRITRAEKRLPQLPRQLFLTAFHELIATPSVHLTVIESNAEVAGYLVGHVRNSLFLEGSVAMVEGLIVLKQWRNLGFGRLLLAEMERWALDRGALTITLAAGPEAGAFYADLGYAKFSNYLQKHLTPI